MKHSLRLLLLLSVFLLLCCEIPLYPYYLVRPGINVSLVLDRSGSMIGTRIQNAREAAVLLVENLEEGDVLSVVVFDTLASVIVEAVKITEETREFAIEKIREIQSGGGTRVSAGLEAGYSQLSLYRDEYFFTTLVLLCDGDVDSAMSEPLVAAALRDGIQTSTIVLDPEGNRLEITV